MVEFKFADYGTDFGTRDMGAKLRGLLRPMLDGDERVVLDFTGVNVVTNSFADECIAKLLLEIPLEELKKRTTFRGLNPVANKSVLVALQRRYRVIKQQQTAS
ncbi:MAG: STAS-like domain-containing protein [Prevotella sp.]|nr:STAS-like domain-containing protein [Prevotella sp.]